MYVPGCMCIYMLHSTARNCIKKLFCVAHNWTNIIIASTSAIFCSDMPPYFLVFEDWYECTGLAKAPQCLKIGMNVQD